MRSLFVASLLLLLCPLPAGAGEDVPVAGRWLSVHQGEARSQLQLTLRDPAIRALRFDPREFSGLALGSSAAPGRCRSEQALDPGNWQRIGFFFFLLGWLYLDVGPDGALVIFVGRGVVHVFARGDHAACGLAGPQGAPLTAELRAGGRRFCAAFGGDVLHDDGERYAARNAAAPAACPDADLSVANLNILHGISCEDDLPGQCRLVDRVALLFDWIEASGCPDVVTLQEVAEVEPFVPISVRDVIAAEVPGRCPFEYELFFAPVSGLDEELVLSRYPILDSEVRVLHAAFPAPVRHVTHVRVDHPAGPVDVFTTHFSSSADLANNPCDNAFAACPQACVDAGALTARECQAVEMVDFVALRHDVDTPAVVTGDMNARPDSFELATLLGAGWIDSHLASGNPECDPATGIGCTSGRDTSLAQLESSAANVSARIDYTLVVPPGPGSLCEARLDGPGDDDGDGAATRIFADEPNPFAACGPAPLPVCWPSDHEGSELDLDCF